MVREAAVDALATLYDNEDNVLPLHEFVTRFRTRIGELIYDVDDSVAVKGVRISCFGFLYYHATCTVGKPGIGSFVHESACAWILLTLCSQKIADGLVLPAGRPPDSFGEG